MLQVWRGPAKFEPSLRARSGPTTLKAQSRYLTAFRVPTEARTKNFFLNIFGEPLKHEVIKTVFDRLKTRSGIARLQPHLLGHTAATRMG